MSNFSVHDRKYKVKLPSLSSALLAYETGVHIGDGSLQIIDGSTHSIRYFGHSEDDYLYYRDVLPAIVQQLYNKKVQPGKRKKGKTCYISICSKKVAFFKRDILGLPAGNKIHLQRLPSFIVEDDILLKNMLRGIADTDFSLYFKKNREGLSVYPEISCVMSNKMLVHELAKFLGHFGFRVTTQFGVKRERNGTVTIEHRVSFCGRAQLASWMSTVGFWNPKHYTKYLIWKRFGFCPPQLSTSERLMILNSNPP